jgi:hypothetical protein
MKRFLVGSLWFLGFYFGSCAAIGGAIGFHSGWTGKSENEMNLKIEQVIGQIASPLLLVSAAAAVAGAATQKLPGTKE